MDNVFATTTVLLSKEFSEAYPYKTAQSKLRKLRLVTGVQFSCSSSRTFALHGTWDQIDTSNNILTHWHVLPDHEPDSLNKTYGKDLSKSLCHCLKSKQTAKFDVDTKCQSESESRNDNKVDSSQEAIKLCIYTPDVKRDIKHLEQELKRLDNRVPVSSTSAKSEGHTGCDRDTAVSKDKVLSKKQAAKKVTKQKPNTEIYNAEINHRVNTRTKTTIRFGDNNKSDTECCGNVNDISVQNEGKPESFSRDLLSKPSRDVSNKGEQVKRSKGIKKTRSSSFKPQSNKNVSEVQMGKTAVFDDTLSIPKKSGPQAKRKVGDKGYWSRVKRDDLHIEHQCSECGVVLKSRKRYMEHRKRMHLKEYQCEICLKGFGYPSDLLHHKTKCKGNSEVETKSEPIKGIGNVSVNSGEQINQSVAQKSVKVEASERLSSMKSNDKIVRVKFECHICQKKFNSKKIELQHLKSVHKVFELYSCQKCPKIYKNKVNFANHLKTHEVGYTKSKLICDICGKFFASKSTLLMHHRSEHLGQKQSYLCQICGKHFTQRNSYKQHTNAHNGIQPYRCATCGKTFSYHKSLKEHMYLHDSVRRFRCNICNKRFRQRTTLRIHSKIHKVKKDHVCSVCSKEFTQKQALERHERIHSGVKPYKCLLCEKAFGDQSTIRRHMLSLHQKGESNWRKSMSCSVKKSDYYIQGGLGQNRIYECRTDAALKTTVNTEETKMQAHHSGINQSVIDKCTQKMISTKNELIDHQFKDTEENSIKPPVQISIIPPTSIPLSTTSTMPHKEQNFSNIAAALTGNSSVTNLDKSTSSVGNTVLLYNTAPLQTDSGTSVFKKNLSQYINLAGISFIPTKSLENIPQATARQTAAKPIQQKLESAYPEAIQTSNGSYGLSSSSDSLSSASLGLISVPLSAASRMLMAAVQPASVKDTDPLISAPVGNVPAVPVVSQPVQNTWGLIGCPSYITTPSTYTPTTQ